MSWASPYIILLRTHEYVEFRPRGNSMEPVVHDNELVRVHAVTEETRLAQGDVVLCTVNGRQFLHLIKAVNEVDQKYLIGNNRGSHNGWTPRKNVHGVMVR